MKVLALIFYLIAAGSAAPPESKPRACKGAYSELQDDIRMTAIGGQTEALYFCLKKDVERTDPENEAVTCAKEAVMNVVKADIDGVITGNLRNYSLSQALMKCGRKIKNCKQVKRAIACLAQNTN